MSEQREMDTAKVFFQIALEVSDEAPDRITTDKEASYPRAIRKELGDDCITATIKRTRRLKCGLT